MRKMFGRARVSPALVISIVALVMAVGGTALAEPPVAYIAKALGLSGKQKKQVKAIVNTEIKKQAGSLSVANAAKATNATHAATATNAGHADHAAQAANAAQLEGIGAGGFLRDTVTVVVEDTVGAPNPTHETANAKCPDGYQAIGGGVDNENVLTEMVTASGPTIGNQRPLDVAPGQHGAANGWFGAVRNESGVASEMKVVVICAP